MGETAELDPLIDYRQQRAELEYRLEMLYQRREALREQVEIVREKREYLKILQQEVKRKQQRLLWNGFGRW